MGRYAAGAANAVESVEWRRKMRSSFADDMRAILEICRLDGFTVAIGGAAGEPTRDA